VRALARDLRRWDLVALVVNSIIGAGIFGLPSRVFAIAGTFSLLAYLAAAFALLLVVICFAEVASRFRTTGGPYVYARAAFGPFAGFQIGFLVWLGRVASFASLANLFVNYIGYFIPAAPVEPWRSVILTSLVLALTTVNLLGVRTSTTVTNTLTIAKLTPLCVFALVGLFFVDGHRYTFAAVPSYGAFSQAALLLMFTFTGFEAAVIPAGEMRDPGRHLPFALAVGVGVVTLIYILVQAVCIGTLPDLGHSSRPLADASLQFLGTPGAAMIALGALVSITGTENASMFATPRLLFGMAESGQLPPAFAAIHPRFRTPVLAISVTAVLMLALAVFSSFITALTISTVVRLIAYAVTCAAVPVLRRDRSAPPATFHAFAGPAVAAVGVALCIWLLTNSPANEMRWSIIAVVAGVALYGVLNVRRRRSARA
jgi:amino acid transporter